jgi:hypothetical protein
MKAGRAGRLGWWLPACVAVCGMLGFAVARLGGGRAAVESDARTDAGRPPDARESRSRSVVVPAIRDQVEIPKPDFRDREGFGNYVGRLEGLGLDGDFAKWLALVMLARADFRAAFDLAVAEDLLGPWGAGAAALDPAAAVELIRSLPSHKARDAVWALFPVLGRTNPAEGLGLLKSLPGRMAVSAAFPFFASWAELSPAAAAEAARNLDQRGMRDRALAGVFHAWGVKDRLGMLAWAGAQDARVGRMAFRSLYESSGVRDPVEALDLARRFPAMVDWMMLANVADSLAAMGDAGWQAVAGLPNSSRVGNWARPAIWPTRSPPGPRAMLRRHTPGRGSICPAACK